MPTDEDVTMKSLAPALVGVAVVLLWLGTLWLGQGLFDSWQERGQFGDLFGSVNALFSGLAFVALIYTILLQRQELSLQRVELRAQREEMSASRAELAAQASVQRALWRATVGQIRVAAELARVEAMKMDSESKTPGFRDQWVRDINDAASRIEAIADALDRSEG